MDDLIEKSRRRLAEVSKIIDAARAVESEFNLLSAFLLQVDAVRKRLEPGTSDSAQPHTQTTSGPERPQLQKDGVNQTAELADYVLRVYGPRIRLNDILDRLAEEGWKGSGNRRKDWKNLYNNLSSKKKRFRNVGKNVWERVSEENRK